MKAKLQILINIFTVSPTFLLPIYKDLNVEKYYSHVVKDNKIIRFEEVDLEYYKECGSKFYTIEANKLFVTGDDAIFAIDFENGVIYGDCLFIVSFYEKNKSLFYDNEFVQYMSVFIQENKSLIGETNSIVLLDPIYYQTAQPTLLNRIANTIKDCIWGLLPVSNALYKTILADLKSEILIKGLIYEEQKKLFCHNSKSMIPITYKYNQNGSGDNELLEWLKCNNLYMKQGRNPNREWLITYRKINRVIKNYEKLHEKSMVGSSQWILMGETLKMLHAVAALVANIIE